MVEAAQLSLAEQDAIFRPENNPTTDLNQLVAILDDAGFSPQSLGTIPETPVHVSGISMDSRTVQPGDIYMALAGAKHHGLSYLDQVAQAGARAVVTDAAAASEVIDSALPVIGVNDVRGCVGILSAEIYGNQLSTRPELFGVTGTNGKTTTTYFLRALLSGLEAHTGLIGTIEIRMGQTHVPSRFTTPEATQLHALMARMRQHDVDAVAMEVSSHAISYRRTSGLKFQVSGFTNLTQDHLDLHGSMQEYFDAKAQLFTAEHSQTSVITLNGGPEPRWGLKMAQHVASNLVTLDLGPAASAQVDAEQQKMLDEADWKITSMESAGLGHSFQLTHRNGLTVTTRVGLPGTFNVANAALAAVMVFSAAPASEWPHIATVLNGTDGEAQPFESAVPGRMEVVATRPATVVDFAHNPDGLSQALQAVAHARAESGNVTGRTILVFGATGERDTTKRALMGAIGVDGADVVIISDDDPHSEDPAQIRKQVMAGALARKAELENQGTQRVLEVHESAPRLAALQLAVQLATENDTILAAGRGHETAQDFAGTSVFLDDRQALREALADYGYITMQASELPDEENDDKVRTS